MTISDKKRTATSAFRNAVDTDCHTKQLGENGCPEYTDRGLGSQVLALSQMVRGGDPQSLTDEILATGSPRDVADLVLILFVTRNTRGGKGEKQLAFRIFLRLWNCYPCTAKKLLPLFHMYGYWKDLLLLSEMALADATNVLNPQLLVDAAVELMRCQYEKDLMAVEKFKKSLDDVTIYEPEISSLRKKGPEISLLAKWLPREGSHFDKKVNFINRFVQAPQVNVFDKVWKSRVKAHYRKKVAELTSFLELPEVMLSAHKADEINFSKVTSKATLLLTKAFLNEDPSGAIRCNDPKRMRCAELFVDHLMKKGAKGSQVMPHEIVRKIMNGRKISRSEEVVLDAQWKDLWKNVVREVKNKAKEEGLDFDPTQMVPLSDVSGSMYGIPMEVSIALGIGISEITHPAFQDMVMTFESNPRWHRLNKTDSIVQKVRSLEKAPWGNSTNFEAAYDLILQICRDHKLSREDMPAIIVFSDMQFNDAVFGYGYKHRQRHGNANRAATTMHDHIRSKVASVAQELGWKDLDPKPIVYWNLRNTGGHPVEKDEAGTVLLAGFSPSLLKLVMNGDALKEEEVEIVEADGTVRTEKVRVTPEQVLRKMLDDPLYDPVREILVSSREGALIEYGGTEDHDFELI